MQNKEKMYHINLSKEDIKNAKYAILPGDPDRVEKIASLLDGPVFLTSNREYKSYLGKIGKENVLVISTGIGGPSTAICVEELSLLGLKYLIRVGTCGGMQLSVKAGDIVIANAAIRAEGTSKEYLPIEYPAVADFDLVLALKMAVKELQIKGHIGVVHCKDSFYGQHNPAKMPISYELKNKWQAWLKAGALASEMETASLYTVANTRKIKAAAVLLTVWNQERERQHLDNKSCFDTERAIKVAILAIRKIINKEI